MLKRCVYAAVLMLFLTFLSLYLAYNLHYILLGEADRCTASLSDLKEVSDSLKDTKIRSFFAIFESVGTMLTLYAFAGKKALNGGGTMRVTREIRTPKPAGKGQFGSARWLRRSEYRKTFASVSIAKLLKEGMKDGDVYRDD